MSEATATAIPEESGSISVHTENLFPIIKKWLYSEHDIFLRELVSNSVDACTKLSRLHGVGQVEGELPAFSVNIAINKPGKTITISDNGVGMTRDEVKKYINQIAFSGAQDFLDKFKDAGDGSQIIGHFGMGFFSSFMVADKVEIYTQSHEKGSEPVRWVCEGSTSFQMGPGPRTERGTDVVLHLNKESEEFLDEDKVKELVTRYSNFLPIEIKVNGQKANDQHAIWNQAPSKTTDDDYKVFYKKLFPFEEDPLFWVHFQVDFPFTLKGILYFPKVKAEFDPRTRGRIRLFCNNVFVSDNIAELLPPYLNMLQGVIDSPDIPLNVSRSFLQGDPQVKKIGTHITAKVAERISLMFKESREVWAKHWADIHTFVKYGCLTDEKFYDKVKDALLFQVEGGDMVSLKEYQEKNSLLKDRVIYTSDPKAQHAYLERIKAKGVQSLIFDSPIDTHFLGHLEMKMHPLRFARVDSDTPEALISGAKPEGDGDKELVESLKKSLEMETLQVSAQALADDAVAAMVVQGEQMRRFAEMAQLSQGKMADSLLGNHTLVVNTKHPLVTRYKLWSTLPEKAEEVKNLGRTLYDLALLQQGALAGQSLADFVKKVTHWAENSVK